MFDIGVNLTSRQFSHDVTEVIQRAKMAEVNGLLITGTNLLESGKAREIAVQHPGYCWSTAGVHPHDASIWSDEIAEALFQLAQQSKVVAVGECGLDFNRNFSSPQQQERAFSAQLALAVELNKPLFLHCRDAHQRFIQLLKPKLGQLPAVILHCFTGSQQELTEVLSLGVSVGITGWICDERRGQVLSEIVSLIPIEQLLVETDAPYLLPRNLQPRPTSRRNEPCYLPHIVAQLAWLRGEDPIWLGQQTELNAHKLLQLC